MKTLLLTIVFSLALVSGSFGQIISVTPALPTDQNSIEVIFDASLGSGGLKDYTGDIYAHTGVTTNLSPGWTYVVTPWPNGTNLSLANTAKNKLISLGNNKWKLVIGPSIRSYYNVPAGEVIKSLAFVFRNADGSKEGKTVTKGDIFYDVSPSSLNVSITNPAENFLFADLNQSIPVSVSSLFADSTLLYVNGLKIAATNTNQINISITASAYGQYLVKAVAKTSSAMVADSFYYYVRPAAPVADLPAGMIDGINYLSQTSVLLCLYAPLKQYAFVIGDFNNWIPGESSYMNRTTDGKRYWIQINNLVPGKEYIYQYLVDGKIRIGDPYADKVSDPWNDQYITSKTYPGMIAYPSGKTQGVATVLQTAKLPYVWTSTSFTPPAVTDMIIYELLLRDFSADHSFQSLIDTLGYLKRLGINTIELMPVSEFEGNLSWGYNPDYYFAVDKYYGPANDFKKLVDICHQNGMAVVMDMVLNHAFGLSPYVMLYWDGTKPSANSPFYNPVAKHDFNVGFDMNHESPDTKNYVSRVLKYWINEYHVDGYRFDLSKGFTQQNTLGNTGAWGNYDASRIAILSAYHDTIVKANSKAVLILEHFADNSEEKVLADKGMMLWGNMNYNYCEAAMGYPATSDLNWGVYTSRNWNQPNLVTYMESHDEERQMYKSIKYGASNGNYVIKDTLTALSRAALTATFFYTVPGPKMLWQFGERGYDYSINWPTYTDESRLAQKPPRWDYMQNRKRVDLYNQVAALIKLKKENPVFESTDFTMHLAGAMKKIRLRNDTISMVVLGNFDVTNGTIIPDFYKTGTWYEFFTGDTLNVTNITAPIALKAGEYRIYSNRKLNFPYGVDNIPANLTQVSVAPNPVVEKCNILITCKGINSCEVDVYTSEGKYIRSLFSGMINNQLSLEWKPNNNGIYLLRIQTGKLVTSRRIIVAGR